ncbi:MAG TPA: SDR family NAD(P)-dependent oxidoreductase, partial [Steroidobacteraceae bacterium]|nr:SDR family NAD(P)-dependent oxidoreductase [Steroidobacteraceae bacterium]
MNGQIALVSGASRGIGAAIAERLAAEGARVIGTATTAEGAARITENLSARGGRGAVLNVTSQESIDALIADIEGKEGAIGILCNNAGITRDGLLLRMKQDDWEAVIQTNLASVFRLSKAVLRGMMKARTGRIVSITSVVGLTGNPGQANYAAAKAGILGFTKSLAREVGSRGITVNAI